MEYSQTLSPLESSYEIVSFADVSTLMVNDGDALISLFVWWLWVFICTQSICSQLLCFYYCAVLHMSIKCWHLFMWIFICSYAYNQSMFICTQSKARSDICNLMSCDSSRLQMNAAAAGCLASHLVDWQTNKQVLSNRAVYCIVECFVIIFVFFKLVLRSTWKPTFRRIDNENRHPINVVWRH